MRPALALLMFVAGLLLAPCSGAVGTSGASSSVVLPVVVNSSSYTTEVFVTNRNPYAIEVDVLYYVANNSYANGAPPGLASCGLLSLSGGETKIFAIAVQCPSIAGLTGFGMLVLRDRAARKVHPFYAYARVQQVTTGAGFSIEGFPEHVFSAASSIVAGLKRIENPTPYVCVGRICSGEGPPWAYQPNCFVAALGDPVSYRILLQDRNGAPIGGSLTGTLGPYELYRYLDVFAAAGLPDTDHAEVQVVFASEPTPQAGGQGAALIGACTLQDKWLGADFRIAKSEDGQNVVLSKLACRGANPECTDVRKPGAQVLPDGATAHRWSLFVHHPDHVLCTVLGPGSGTTELRLRKPGLEEGTAGELATSAVEGQPLYYETGPRRAAYGSSLQSFWSLEISGSEGIPPTYPIEYGLRCESGSGIHLHSAPQTVSGDW